MCWKWGPFARQKQGNDVYPKHDSIIYSIRWFCKKTIFDLPIMLPERSRKHLEKGALANWLLCCNFTIFQSTSKNWSNITLRKTKIKNQHFLHSYSIKLKCCHFPNLCNFAKYTGNYFYIARVLLMHFWFMQ